MLRSLRPTGTYLCYVHRVSISNTTLAAATASVNPDGLEIYRRVTEFIEYAGSPDIEVDPTVPRLARIGEGNEVVFDLQDGTPQHVRERAVELFGSIQNELDRLNKFVREL